MLARILVPALLLAVSLSATAAELQILGLFRDMVILRVDGTQYTLRRGESAPEGIKLIAANSEQAVLEIDGRQARYELGTHISASFAPRLSSRAMIRSRNGMYAVQGYINGQTVQFVVDTGASYVVLDAGLAQSLGIDYRQGQPSWATTANGRARIYRLRLDSVQVGEIVLHDVEAAILDQNVIGGALLGMSFLNRVQMKNEGQILLLHQKW